MSENKYLVDNITALRRKNKMTQDKLAEACGVTVGTIARIETNVNVPSIETLVKIAKALGTTTDELLGLVESQKDPTQKHKEMADKIYGKPEQKTITVGELGKEDLKELIKETIVELGQKSQSPEQSISSKPEFGELSKEEVKIIELLREKPHYASTIVKLLTPSNATTNNTTVSLPPKVDVAVRKRAK